MKVQSILIVLLFPVVFALPHLVLFYPFFTWGPLFNFLLLNSLFITGCWWLVLLILRDPVKTDLLVFFCLSFYYFFSLLHDTLRRTYDGALIAQYRFQLPFSLLVILIFVIWLLRTKANLLPWRNYLSTVLVLMTFLGFGNYLLKILLPPKPGSVRLAGEPFKWTIDSEHKPDIYLIVLDELANSVSLTEQFGYDNSALDEGLRQNGFQIIPALQSNYHRTHFSLASMFNLQYLDIPKAKKLVYEDYIAAFNLIRKNQLAENLQNSGYGVRSFSNFRWGDGDSSVSAIDPDLVMTLRSHTVFRKIQHDILWAYLPVVMDHSYYVNNREIFLRYHQQVKKALLTASADEHVKPQFIYAHFFLSHAPYLYKEGDSLRSAKELSGDTTALTKADAYLDNMQHVRKEIIELVQELKNKTKGDAMILILGDHGFRSELPEQDSSSYFSSFGAIYLPKTKTIAIPDSFSSINLLPYVFNSYFGTQIPIQADRSYFLLDE